MKTSNQMTEFQDTISTSTFGNLQGMKVPVFSVRHISREDCQFLRMAFDDRLAHVEFVGYGRRQDFMLRLSSSAAIVKAAFVNCTDQLKVMMLELHAAGIRWVRFCPEGAVYSRFKVFDHYPEPNNLVEGKPATAEDITAAIKVLLFAWQRIEKVTARDINSGRCESFGVAVKSYLRAAGLTVQADWITGMAHYAIMLDGLCFDAENPEGKPAMELEFWKRELKANDA